ncbi:hypothetical protein [Geminisphaera colitermitum]|uniref:hypothetical protein n=1 Tax=Geminisphaera colitermitum TaxID=1148786 RepID=UPI000158D482|nr:hypothetical protein [Geminisphaera colitermitum]
MKPNLTDGIPPVRTTFSLYTEDLDALRELRRKLRGLGLRIDTAKTVRGIIHITSESELLARSIIQFKADEGKGGPRESEMVDARFSVIIPGDDSRKLDDVVDELDMKRIKMSRSYILRALIRSLPPVETLFKPLAKFTKEKNDAVREQSIKARAAARAAKTKKKR